MIDISFILSKHKSIFRLFFLCERCVVSWLLDILTFLRFSSDHAIKLGLKYNFKSFISYYYFSLWFFLFFSILCPSNNLIKQDWNVILYCLFIFIFPSFFFLHRIIFPMNKSLAIFTIVRYVTTVITLLQKTQD